MSWVFWTVISLLVVCLVGSSIWYVRHLRSQSASSSKPVLPSHYDPENYYVNPSQIPGWCPHCETKNEADYRFCANCSAELVQDRSSGTDSWHIPPRD